MDEMYASDLNDSPLGTTEDQLPPLSEKAPTVPSGSVVDESSITENEVPVDAAVRDVIAYIEKRGATNIQTELKVYQGGWLFLIYTNLSLSKPKKLRKSPVGKLLELGDAVYVLAERPDDSSSEAYQLTYLTYSDFNDDDDKIVQSTSVSLNRKRKAFSDEDNRRMSSILKKGTFPKVKHLYRFYKDAGIPGSLIIVPRSLLDTNGEYCLCKSLQAQLEPITEKEECQTLNCTAEKLKAAYDEALGKNLSIENACENLILADISRAGKLKSLTLDFISRHAAEVVDTDGWGKMAKSHFHLATDAFRMLANRQDPSMEPPKKRLKTSSVSVPSHQ